MASGPVTPAELDRLRKLHAEGVTMGEAARRLGRSKSTIQKHAVKLGLSWDRDQTANAAKARNADAKARRAEIGERLLKIAEHSMDQALAVLAEASARDAAVVLGIAVDKHIALERLDTDNGAENAKSMIGELADALRAVSDQLPPENDGA